MGYYVYNGPTLCGTMRGYRQHRAHNQYQCAACNEASNVEQRRRRADKARKGVT